ncbi:three-Cys-motif partner protein TcmP [Luteibacter sp. NPDC031894]|uniref:three-Cys-motif partner protein TcmP n=1 Tax=Luteibacter sp. NPDC031894 TaxID=3390572 RepID=UPI003CFF5337
MTLSPYSWKDGPAIIEQHSVAKHEVLREYLVAYFRTLVTSPGQDKVNLSLVDGFAGGGLFTHADSRRPVLGSPLIMLEAAQEARATIELGRQKALEWAIDYFFVEKDRHALAALDRTLRQQGYGARIGTDIKLLKGAFAQHVEAIVAFIAQKSPRAGRSIFLLDQYGYKDVPTAQIRSIFARLPRAEIILTFAVDSFINFAHDGPRTQAVLDRIGLGEAFGGRRFDDIRHSEKDARLYIQGQMHQELVRQCGAAYYTVFFIRTTGHGVYWLVHLSQHPRARDVMTQVHWKKNNHFIHYGGAGIDMFGLLGYQASHDAVPAGQNEFGFCFDDVAGAASVAALEAQLIRRVHAAPEGTAFGTLFADLCNTSPASSDQFRQALARLVDHKALMVRSPEGQQRRTARTIAKNDLLLVPPQASLFLPP